MKKRLLTLILCVCLVFSAACTAEDSSRKNDDDDNRKSEETEVTEEETEATEEETEDVSETTGNALGFDEIELEEQTIVDKDGIVITVISFENDEFYGPIINVQIENNTEQNQVMSVYGMKVNGIAIDGSLYCEVSTGKKANAEIYLDGADLEVSGISTIKDLEIVFEGYDSDSYDTLFMSDAVTFSTNADESFVQTVDDSGTVVYDENGIRVVMKETIEIDEFGDPYFVLFVENDTDAEIYVSMDDVSVNGVMLDPFFASIVPAGTVDFEDAWFSVSDLEDNDISEIEEIEFSLYAYDWDTMDDVFTTDMITLTVQG
ncbi:MAG: hypothetical protein JW817_08100 [Clostridiales bacterium]|nr:hypothetical protein [Clostridiales bacterium]